FEASSPAVTFQLSGETDNKFYINPNGLLFYILPLDREKRAIHHLQVSTQDAQGNKVDGPVPITIIVEDINDNPPIFLLSNYEGSVRQNSRPGKPFIYVNATDKDDPATPNGQLNYEIIAQLPMVDNVNYFQIDKITGGISLTPEGSQKLDVSKKVNYDLVVLVKDMASQPFRQTTQVHITVLENIWKAPDPVEIVENSTDPHPIKITQVQWNEPGAHYSLVEKEKLPRFPFSIDQEGAIYVTQPLDREEKDSVSKTGRNFTGDMTKFCAHRQLKAELILLNKPLCSETQYIIALRHDNFPTNSTHFNYSFYAVAKSASGDLLARPLQIDVKVKDINDNPPTCPSAVTVFEVQENEYVGSNIGTFTAHDMDEENSVNSILKYRLVDQTPRVPSNNLFLIDTYLGTLQLAKQSLKKKNSPQYNLTVAVSDNDFETHCLLQIKVIDVNDQIPIFEKSDYETLTLSEDTAIGSTILTIQATDDDEQFTGSSKILYHIIEGDSEGQLEVQTDPQTNAGYVTIKKRLDFETTPVHNIVFRAENPEPLIPGVNYNDSSIARLKLIVTDVDEPPQFPLYLFQGSVFENVTVGTKVGNVTAWDPEHRNIRYSLKGDRRTWLRIDSNTGEIFSVAPLDRETETPYRVQVVASEVGGSLSSEVEFQLILLDVNDNAPRLMEKYIGSLFFCYPHQAPGNVTFGATDDDVQSFRGPQFTFSFARENLNEKWELSRINGTHASLSTKPGDFEEKVYNVDIRISDGARPPLDRVVSLPVTFCKCEFESCYRPAGRQPGIPTVGMVVGVLLTTFLVIGIILAVVFMRIKKKGDAENAHPAETKPLKRI
ncbi:Cadherin-17, partial [Galemys pyrenaicus]